MEVDSEQFRALRLSRLLTQAELAEQAGVTESTVNRIEQGHQAARISTVRKLARALDVPPADLLAKAPESAGQDVENS